MERLIVNEGAGPVPRDLTAPLLHVGGSEGCELVLRHPSAIGIVFSIERTTHGHCARWVAGAVFHNEQPLRTADLLHNDTLRAGETLVLYKNPLATLPVSGPAPAAARVELAPLTFDEVAIIEELEPLDELEPQDERGPHTSFGASAGHEAATEPPQAPAGTPQRTSERDRRSPPPSARGMQADVAADGRGKPSAPGGGSAHGRGSSPPARRGPSFQPPRHRGRPSR